MSDACVQSIEWIDCIRKMEEAVEELASFPNQRSIEHTYPLVSFYFGT
jgi:hypothetical protein